MKPLEKSFHSRALKLHYLEWNGGARGPALVFLHGAGANAWWWDLVCRRMPASWRLWALDQRGHGASQWARPPAYGAPDYAADIAAFVRALALNAPVIVGHSMGALNGLAYAAAFPAAVSAAVAVDVAAPPSARRKRLLSRLAQMPAPVYPDLAAARRRFSLMPPEDGVASSVRSFIAARSVAPARQGGYTLSFDRALLGADAGADVFTLVRALTVPLLLVRGERSQAMSATTAAQLARLNPGATMVTLGGAGHHIPLERPRELARAIVAFVRLRGLDRAWAAERAERSG
ncbi:MAG: alpha/beta hydrolase [Deltaproteobacteria bacterium]|jgi:pimeloyl-ACP methyl ester carboxylesterase|nr:alpha/beta hydrolase [Deltaproteobacteria bacterium]